MEPLEGFASYMPDPAPVLKLSLKMQGHIIHAALIQSTDPWGTKGFVQLGKKIEVFPSFGQWGFVATVLR